MPSLLDVLRSILRRSGDAVLIAKRWVGERDFDDLMVVWTNVAVALSYADYDKNRKLDKREVLAVIIEGALRLVTGRRDIPNWICIGIADSVFQRIKIPDFEIPLPMLKTGEAEE
jgi:hypothetical protein